MEIHNKLNRNNIEDIMPLTSMQEGMLFHYTKDEDSREYHEQISLEISGEVKLELLQRAWDYVIETNEMLRAVFRWKKLDNPVQIVQKEHKVLLQYIDLTDEINKDEVLEIIKQNDLKNKIDITKESLRVYLCKLDYRKYNMIIKQPSYSI